MSVSGTIENFLELGYLPEKATIFRNINDLFEEIDHSNCTEFVDDFLNTYTDAPVDWLASEIEETYKANLLTLLLVHGIHINADSVVNLNTLYLILLTVIRLPQTDLLTQAGLILNSNEGDNVELGYKVCSLMTELTQSEFYAAVEDIEESLFDNIRAILNNLRPPEDGLGSTDEHKDIKERYHTRQKDTLEDVVSKFLSNGGSFGLPINTLYEFMFDQLMGIEEIKYLGRELYNLVLISNTTDEDIMEVTNELLDRLPIEPVLKVDVGIYLQTKLIVD